MSSLAFGVRGFSFLDGLLFEGGCFEEGGMPGGVSRGLLNLNISSNSRLGLTTYFGSLYSREEFFSGSCGLGRSIDCLAAILSMDAIDFLLLSMSLSLTLSCCSCCSCTAGTLLCLLPLDSNFPMAYSISLRMDPNATYAWLKWQMRNSTFCCCVVADL